jgi:hypothetical protein
LPPPDDIAGQFQAKRHMVRFVGKYWLLLEHFGVTMEDEKLSAGKEA